MVQTEYRDEPRPNLNKSKEQQQKERELCIVGALDQLQREVVSLHVQVVKLSGAGGHFSGERDALERAGAIIGALKAELGLSDGVIVSDGNDLIAEGVERAK